MDQPSSVQIRAILAASARRLYDWTAQIPAKARVMLGLFLLAALLMALHTAFSGKNASLHLRVQHGFRSADISLFVDGDLAYSGELKGSMKKKFGLIPDSVQGTLSQEIATSSGTHQIRVKVVSDDGSVQEDSISAEFLPDRERELSVTARRSGLALNMQAMNSTPGPAGTGWIGHYAGTLLLTVAGSIVSALTGFALKELPAQIRSQQNSETKTQSASAGQ